MGPALSDVEQVKAAVRQAREQSGGSKLCDWLLCDPEALTQRASGILQTLVTDPDMRVDLRTVLYFHFGDNLHR
ncbi:hypothetical protein NDU88_007106 [Pleurodeles waltl]|uniref:Uncharacterized protein n=1 Tax=Pleurodeles waltl TaxID=8319 RepID=A0AAV7LR38_PLEWA|nr:hypothetical protein NDU88_007106 [Pleurodeles waltl]